MSNEVQPQTKEIQSPWLTAEEAYKYLRLPSRKALYERVSRGLVPHHRDGGRLLFDRNEMDEAIRTGRNPIREMLESLQRPSAERKGGKRNGR